MAVAERHRVVEHLKNNFELYASRLLKIVPKDRTGKRLVPFILNEGQRALNDILEAQRLAGKPQRAIVLKARRVGISTYVQGKLIQRATLDDHHNALVVAHNADTGAKLFAMGERMYGSLPDEPELKPPVRGNRRGRLIHFADPGDAWKEGELWPDSSYYVDTAGEFQAGRGAEYHSLHASELAFWPQPGDKLDALLPTLPEGDPDSFCVYESTANGHNLFKDEWDRAEAGDSEFAAFFWPWWKQREYARDFANAAERADFKIGELPYGEDEPALVNPGPLDPLTGEHVPLTLEQLHWRRMTIANVCSGRVEKFKQEYPATPAEAFLMTGRRVFDPIQVAVLLSACERTDPKVPTEEHPGPVLGNFGVAETRKMVGRQGPLDVPAAPKWLKREALPPDVPPQWKLWETDPPPENGYVIGVDVSEGISESDTDSKEPAFHAIEVVNHKTGAQVAEYRSRIDTDLLAEQVLLAALYFNDAWVAVEKTGFYGTPVVRRLYHDYHYMFCYFRKASHERRSDEKSTDRLGWDTNRETKPILIAGATELLREGTTGIRSSGLAREIGTYVRNEKGKMMPEPGRFADRFMAWAIARQVSLEKPFKAKRPRSGGGVRVRQARDIEVPSSYAR